MIELKSIKIDKNIHKKIKIHCSSNDINIKNFIEKLINEYFKNINKNDNR